MASSQFPPGTQVGRYEIVRHLAFGGMAELYLARVIGSLEGFEKQVVLKCVAPHLVDREDYVAMFLDEARMAAVLDHPNIVQVHDIGVQDGNWYFTMEYVRGCNVRDLLNRLRSRGERMPLGVAVAITQGVLLGLHAAHAARGKDGKALHLVHRDVSPSNVVVGTNGNVKLIDFGIAKANERQTQTLSGIVKGKYAYMSPEQCRGQKLDRRSDIFSTGILLFELVSGVRLFDDANEYVVMQKLLNGDVPHVNTLRPDVPPDLEAIIDRALAASPEDRFGTAELMYRALTKLEDKLGAVSQFEIADFVRSVFPEDARPEHCADGSAPELETLTRRKPRPVEQRQSTDSILRALRDRFDTRWLGGSDHTQQFPMQLRAPAPQQVPLGLRSTSTSTSGAYAMFEILSAVPATDPPNEIALGSSKFARVDSPEELSPAATRPMRPVAMQQVEEPPPAAPAEATKALAPGGFGRRWLFAVIAVVALGISIAAVAHHASQTTPRTSSLRR